jgi:hypothetical protein
LEAAVAMAAVAAEHSVKIANNALGFVGCMGFMGNSVQACARQVAPKAAGCLSALSSALQPRLSRRLVG